MTSTLFNFPSTLSETFGSSESRGTEDTLFSEILMNANAADVVYGSTTADSPSEHSPGGSPPFNILDHNDHRRLSPSLSISSNASLGHMNANIGDMDLFNFDDNLHFLGAATDSTSGNYNNGVQQQVSANAAINTAAADSNSKSPVGIHQQASLSPSHGPLPSPLSPNTSTLGNTFNNFNLYGTSAAAATEVNCSNSQQLHFSKQQQQSIQLNHIARATVSALSRTRSASSSRLHRQNRYAPYSSSNNNNSVGSISNQNEDNVYIKDEINTTPSPPPSTAMLTSQQQQQISSVASLLYNKANQQQQQQPQDINNNNSSSTNNSNDVVVASAGEICSYNNATNSHNNPTVGSVDCSNNNNLMCGLGHSDKLPIRRIVYGKAVHIPTVEEKKNSHNKIERRYRDKINGQLGELRDILPPLADKNKKKLNKAGTMKCAVNYISFLKLQNLVYKSDAEKLMVVLMQNNIPVDPVTLQLEGDYGGDNDSSLNSNLQKEVEHKKFNEYVKELTQKHHHHHQLQQQQQQQQQYVNNTGNNNNSKSLLVPSSISSNSSSTAGSDNENYSSSNSSNDSGGVAKGTRLGMFCLFGICGLLFSNFSSSSIGSGSESLVSVAIGDSGREDAIDNDTDLGFLDRAGKLFGDFGRDMGGMLVEYQEEEQPQPQSQSFTKSISSSNVIPFQLQSLLSNISSMLTAAVGGVEEEESVATAADNSHNPNHPFNYGVLIWLFLLLTFVYGVVVLFRKVCVEPVTPASSEKWSRVFHLKNKAVSLDVLKNC